MPVIAFVLATFVATASTRLPIVPPPPKPQPIDTIGLYHQGLSQYFLRNSNTEGTPDLEPGVGRRGDLPFTGDFDGNGVTDLGVFQSETGTFVIRMPQLNFPDFVITLQFVGQPGDLPIAGDWDGDGVDTLGIYRRNGGFPPIFGLTNGHVAQDASLKPEIVFELGEETDLPVAGDWNGDGLDTVGVYRVGRSSFALVNNFGAGIAETFFFGEPDDLPLAGDWDGDGRDGVGTYREDEHAFRLTNDSGATTALLFRYLSIGDLPVAGDWDGVTEFATTSFTHAAIAPVKRKPDTIGLYDFAREDFLLRDSNSTGLPDIVQPIFARDGDLPFTGDFDANGETELGVYRPSTGQFLVLWPFPEIIERFTFVGQPGDVPVIGDWDGDGFDTFGIYRDDGISPPIFALTNAHLGTNGKVEITFELGQHTDRPLAGDWDGDGIDTVGIYRPGRSTFMLVNDFGAGVAIGFTFGLRGDRPFSGDWDGDGVDGVGVYRLDEILMQLTNDFGNTGIEFLYLSRGDVPVSGNWDGF
ncbi:MAG TPA: hypothetical protein VEK79_07525 [Thermoanaerobaculia bacterium]|nr:hypothetical protein [Thermoanaerobaculia bacterium]